MVIEYFEEKGFQKVSETIYQKEQEFEKGKLLMVLNLDDTNPKLLLTFNDENPLDFRFNIERIKETKTIGIDFLNIVINKYLHEYNKFF